MDLTFTPYKEIGSLPFYASNDSAIKVFGEPISQSKYGYPEKNKHSYDYGFFHVLLSEDLKFEAIELFPDMTDEIAFLFRAFREYTDILPKNPEKAKKRNKGV